MSGQSKIYEMVNEKIISLLEQGTIPWKKPWSGKENIPKNISGYAYHGINSILLSMMGFSSPYFLTFKQCTAAGGQIKKGEHGTPVIFWKWLEYENKDNPKEKTQVPFLRYYTIFNLTQCQDFPKGYLDKFQPEEQPEKEFNPIQEAEEIWKNYKTKPEIINGGNRACYSPSRDQITIPKYTNFNSEEEYYASLFHEGLHSTGHKLRLNRNIENTYGTSDYGKEELIAEMGASFLCAICKIESKVIVNSAAYITGWLKAITLDHKVLISAAAKAQVASDYILGVNQKEDKK